MLGPYRTARRNEEPRLGNMARSMNDPKSRHRTCSMGTSRGPPPVPQLPPPAQRGPLGPSPSFRQLLISRPGQVHLTVSHATPHCKGGWGSRCGHSQHLFCGMGSATTKTREERSDVGRPATMPSAHCGEHLRQREQTVQRHGKHVLLLA